MKDKIMGEFYWNHIESEGAFLTDTEKYQMLIDWAKQARRVNPDAFDAVTMWILDDSQWTEDQLDENKQILLNGVLAGFRKQNAELRTCLENMMSSGLVNDTVFKALDRFDEELAGRVADRSLQEAVSKMFSDFSSMLKGNVRRYIAGSVTGSFGTDTKDVDIYGYINYLKDCDAALQWALFMPSVVEQQQNGFKVKTFEYKRMSAMRFIGKEISNESGADIAKERSSLFHTLDGLHAYQSGFNYDVLFQHHYGKGVDVEKRHGFWGRFMKSNTPVPEGFIYFDFIPQRPADDFTSGPPFIAQFAFATFTGDSQAMHKSEGYDSDAMYDVTRNIMLGEGVNIPYPDKYWTAEVFLNGYEQNSSAYMFSASLTEEPDSI